MVGFTGSQIWPYVAQFPPVPASVIDAGYEDFAHRWNPILDVFDAEGVRFAHEVHPVRSPTTTGPACAHWTRSATAPRSASTGTRSHMMWQNIDPVGFIVDFEDRIYHVDCKDTRMRPHNGRAGVLGSHLPWGDPHRGWDFVSTGHGDVPWEDAFRALEVDRLRGTDLDRVGGRRAWTGCTVPRRRVGFIRSLLWPLPEASFDAAFTNQ